ncbi:MAG: phospholipase D-like domain-containing protein [Sphingomonadales bacterium]
MRNFLSLGAISLAILYPPLAASAAQAGDVEINEIAWMGTTVSANDEWIELRNTTAAAVSLSGWTLKATDGTPSITLSGSIPAGGFFLLERTDDTTVPGITADLIYTGAMENGGEVLELRDGGGVLIDSVNNWAAGDNTTKATMERIPTGWQTGTAAYDVGLGTPGATNTGVSGGGGGGGGGTTQFLNQVSNEPGAINVYFNKNALTDYATAGNLANHQINLEERLISRLGGAQSTIDLAIYEINLTAIADALIERAAAGVFVRVIADSKDPSPTDTDRVTRYEDMRLQLERLLRGTDGTIGTADDIALFSDSPIFAVEDSAKRTAAGLPATLDGLTQVTVGVGNGTETGYLIADAELKTAPSNYYAEGDQAHNKFAVIDGAWVWTGSWNFTLTGLYGDAANQTAGILGGNTQHSIEINDVTLASAFTTEFEEMWGSSTMTPDPAVSNFHSRKIDNTPHFFTVGGRTVELYFSPGDDAVGNVTSYVTTSADFSAYFSIFAWSTQGLVDALKVKWEGSDQDLVGTLTGFDVQGVFDASFWNQWWSASVDMTGRTASQTSQGNPNTRWANPAPVLIDNEDRKLHSKTMIIDACTVSDPSVVVGSTNWSVNGNDVNDENLLIVHDAAIANQFLQEYYARYQAAGGAIPALGTFSCP